MCTFVGDVSDLTLHYYNREWRTGKEACANKHRMQHEDRKCNTIVLSPPLFVPFAHLQLQESKDVSMESLLNSFYRLQFNKRESQEKVSAVSNACLINAIKAVANVKKTIEVHTVLFVLLTVTRGKTSTEWIVNTDLSSVTAVNKQRKSTSRLAAKVLSR